MTKITGGDFYTLTEIRWMLRETNTAADGVVEVALVQRDEDAPALEFREKTDHVVTLPGNGAMFPERAFAEALRVAPIIVEIDE
jgi:hypothetical protein